MKKKKEKKTFKKINVDAQTFDKISHISKALGLKKAQTVRLVIEPLFEVCSKNHAICKVIKNPMKDAVIFMFSPNETYMIGFPNGKQKVKLPTMKSKVKKP